MPSLPESSNIVTSSPLLWDSFEALFFVISGLFIGFAFGILFPSLWRTFRRSFRKESDYAPQVEKWFENSNGKLTILKDDIEIDTSSENKQILQLKIVETFNTARYVFQSGDVRQAIGLYIDILTSEKVSKEETNRAMYELSQVYFSIGLYQRAFDTAYELLNRKPHLNQVLKHLLKVISVNFEPGKLNSVLEIYKGLPDLPLKRTLSHSICRIVDHYFDSKELTKAIDYARLAVKWDRTSGRSMLLLWEATSKQFWEKEKDSKFRWLSFATDLEAKAQIFSRCKISAAAGAEYFSSIIGMLFHSSDWKTSFPGVRDEFFSIFQWNHFANSVQKNLIDSLFYAHLFFVMEETNTNQDIKSEWNDFYSLFWPENSINFVNFFEFKKQQRDAIFYGVMAHKCAQCQGVVSKFTWQCPYCGLEESFFPVLSV